MSAMSAFLTVSAGIKPRKTIIHVRQSDGTELRLRHVGDGTLSYFLTDDGYVVAKGTTGDFCYVESIGEDSITVSSLIAHNKGRRNESEKNSISLMKRENNMPLLHVFKKSNDINERMSSIGLASTAPLHSIGSPHIPVILVEFKDLAFSVAETAEETNNFFNKYCNGTSDGKNYTEAGSAGAVKDYFIAQSDSLFQPQFTVIGPVTLSKEYAYYGRNSGTRKDINIDRFFSEAIEKAYDKGVDWTQFDNNNDGNVDIAYFIYAGEGENASEDANTIWPKEITGKRTMCGITFDAYVCNNEIYEGKADGIGTMCHELSHALGLPDLYDTGYVAYGMDYWDLMDSGSYCADGYCPCGYSAYEKDFMGWKPLVTLEAGKEQNVTLVPLSEGGCGYKIVNPENPDEYYVVENRQNTKWDSRIGQSSEKNRHHGMLVTHIDYSSYMWTTNQVNTNPDHQRLTLIPADGELYSSIYPVSDNDWDYYLESMAGDPYPGTKEVNELSGDKAFVYTASRRMGQPITDIEEHEDGTVTFVFCKSTTNHIPEIAEDGTLKIDGRNVSTHYAEIYNASGMKVAQTGAIPSTVELQPGIYVVRTKNGTQKIAIK